MGSKLRFALTCATAMLGVMATFASRAAEAPARGDFGPAPAVATPAPELLPQDDIVLAVTPGPAAGQIVLSWTGGLPLFNIFRSPTVPVLITPANNLGATNNPGWFDAPPAGDIFYYEIRGTGCASDAGCPTGHCKDRYCCDAACTGTCQRCDLAGAEGSCMPVARGEDPDGDCGASARCDGGGACLLIDGATCTAPAQCLSALCTLFFRDADGDGFGTPNAFVAACGALPPTGYATNFTDCSDADGAIRPGATEIVGDAVDQNCDGLESCYRDGDGDGYRTGLVVTSSDSDCADPGEARSSAPAGDCCDTDSLVHPGETVFSHVANLCGSFDYNCDGIQTQQLTTLSTTTIACGGTPPLCVDLGTGWIGIVPACGQGANYRDCDTACGTWIFPWTQRCR